MPVKELTRIEKITKEIRDNYSQRLFHMDSDTLNIGESLQLDQYMRDLSKERFAQVVIRGIPTIYLVSTTGKVVNSKTGKELKHQITNEGYHQVCIFVDGKPFNTFAHRLVALAFIPNPENKPEVNHIDGNKDNNHLSNLEWVTSKENTAHAIAMGLKWYFGQKGEQNPCSVYTDEQVKEACKLMENPMNRPIMISRVTGIDRSDLYKIRTGKSWEHISRNYVFPDTDFIYGENNCNNKYNEDQIHDVCKLLESPKNNPKYISEITGVSTDTIQNIKSGKVWRHISSMYEFPHNKFVIGSDKVQSIYSDQQIHQVCYLLQDSKYTYQFIEEFTGVNIHTVYRIAKGKYWRHISKDYDIDFNADRSSGKPRNEETPRIIELLETGISNKEIAEIIMAEFGLQDRRKAQLKVSDVKSRFITHKK